jgi:hypothetical protein
MSMSTPATSSDATLPATDETTRLIAADKVNGTSVYNRQGEHLGAIEDVMLDKISGKVAYAVLAFGGFLGIGERYHPLPWSVLAYDTQMGGYVVDLDRSRLEGAPTFAANDDVDWNDRAWGKRVNDYYGTTPWWHVPPAA